MPISIHPSHQPTNFFFIIIFLEFFRPALADDFSLEFEWQQVS